MWYKCLIRVENFPGSLANTAPLVQGTNPVAPHDMVGFFVTRFVEANSTEHAEQCALFLLRSELSLIPSANHTYAGKAIVFFEEISEVEVGEIPDPQPGLVFHPMSPNVIQ